MDSFGKGFFLVSDHAVLRYLERIKKVNVDKARQEIAQVIAENATDGATSIELNGITYVMRDGCVVTTLSPEMMVVNLTRDKLVNIRLTKEEHAAIEKAAKAAGAQVAVFIRMAAIKDAAEAGSAIKPKKGK
jgi:hypothetical protein